MHILLFSFIRQCFGLSQRGSVKWQVDKENTCSLHLSLLLSVLLSVHAAPFSSPLFIHRAASLSFLKSHPFCCSRSQPHFSVALMQPVKHLSQKNIKQEKGNADGSQLLLCTCVFVCSRWRSEAQRQEEIKGGVHVIFLLIIILFIGLV